MRSKILAILALNSGFTFAQAPPADPPGWDAFKQIYRGMQALEASVTTDRADYLPGERVCVTVTVTNPTGAPIPAFAPFRSRFAKLGMSGRTKEEDRVRLGDWTPLADYFPEFGLTPNEDVMTGRQLISIGAGERLRESVCVTDPDADRFDPINHYYLWSDYIKPGRYKFWFSYERRAEVEFEVLEIKDVSALATLPLPEAEQFRRPSIRVPKGCLGIRAAALRTANGTVVVRSLGGTADVCSPTAPSGRELLRAFSPFVRVAEVPDGVRSLSLRPFGEGTSEITWEDGRGIRRQQMLPRPQFFKGQVAP